MYRFWWSHSMLFEVIIFSGSFLHQFPNTCMDQFYLTEEYTITMVKNLCLWLTTELQNKWNIYRQQEQKWTQSDREINSNNSWHLYPPFLTPNCFTYLTRNAEEAEVEWFYEDLQDLLELTPKKDALFIIRCWNAKVGRQELPRVTGKFGLGVQN